MGKLARAIFPVHQPMMMHLTMVNENSRRVLNLCALLRLPIAMSFCKRVERASCVIACR
jgi:hypothetical protein